LEIRTHIKIIKQAMMAKVEAETETQERAQAEVEAKAIAAAEGKLNVAALLAPETKVETEPSIQLSSAEIENLDQVTETDIANVVSNWTGIPLAKLTDSESERLLRMEESLHERIIGQHHAVVSVSKAIRRARVGLRNPNRPIASFIFAGPTGVGKTELTKTLSEYMFGTDDSMIRLDMSEYMEKHTVAKLIGSPPGYVGYTEGGQLTEAVRSKPYSVVLFDEVEKAHPDVFNLLLQILDDGRLSDSQGRVVDFTNTLIIMTTNLGSKIIESESGIKANSDTSDKDFKITKSGSIDWIPTSEPVKDPQIFQRVTKLVNEELKNFFRPEFLNRIDEIIVFSHLTKADVWKICDLMLRSLEKRLKEKEINLTVDLSAQAFLTNQGYDPLYGARPLRRAIMKYLEDTLAEECLSQTLYPNTNILVRRKKVEGTLMSFLNELEVEIDFSEVDPNLLTSQDEKKPVNGTNNLESNTRFVKDQQEALAVAGAEFFANRR
jgi:ATP-dependent Clp protease ATP-binding subunit ClpC